MTNQAYHVAQLQHASTAISAIIKRLERLLESNDTVREDERRKAATLVAQARAIQTDMSQAFDQHRDSRVIVARA